MIHQVYACLRLFLFFFEILSESYFLNTVAILNDEGIPVSLVFCILAAQEIVAWKAAFQLLFRSAFSVFAGCVSTVQTYRKLCISKTILSLS
jgi:hypothetical protein